MNIHHILTTGPVLPVIIVNDVAHAVPLAEALVAGGITVLEITLRTPVALDVIHAIKKRQLPRCLVGAGTVLLPTQFAAIKSAGADFAVSPGISAPLIFAAKDENIPYLPAVATASEVMLGIQHHFSFLKFFPASLNGGVKALNNLMSVFPEIKFCPTGGIDEKTMMDYLALNNVICIGGSWIAPKNLIDNRDWKAITDLTHRTLSQINKRN